MTSTNQPHPYVSIDPAIRAGQPCLNHTRTPVEAIAGSVWAGESLELICDGHALNRADVLVCCWYMANYGEKVWQHRWRVWAESVHDKLWHGQYDIPDPPTWRGPQ